MAKVLLIDNETVLLQKLEALIPGHEFVHKWNDLNELDSNDFDLIVLSGGSGFNIVENESKLKGEITLIKNSKKPIIGICYGCELIVKTFDGVLERSAEDHHGIIDIDILSDDNIFNKKKKIERL